MTVYNNNAIRSAYETLRVKAFGTIPAAYDPLDPINGGWFGDPTEQKARIVTIKNGTDIDVYISLDGVNDHEWIPSQSFDKTDHTTNHAATFGGFLAVPANTQFYVRRGGAITSGQVTLSIVYGSTT